MERETRNKLIVSGTALAVAVGGYALAASKERDYEGAQHSYVVEGVVGGVESDGTIMLHEETLRPVVVNGKAQEWFESQEGRDLFNGDITFEPGYSRSAGPLGLLACEKYQAVANLADVTGTGVAAADLQKGTWVRISGNIRQESDLEKRRKGKTSCSTEDTNVFRGVEILEGN